MKLSFDKRSEIKTLAELILISKVFGSGRQRSIAYRWYEHLLTSSLLDRGYTGHQHLYNFGIINMNGRLYDPVLGRMLSPDLHIQAPSLAQNYNRYSYVLNNPLIYTDPDGEWVITALFMFGNAYLNATMHNGWKFNPAKWDWRDPGTYFSIARGLITGHAQGIGIEESLAQKGTESLLETPFINDFFINSDIPDYYNWTAGIGDVTPGFRTVIPKGAFYNPINIGTVNCIAPRVGNPLLSSRVLASVLLNNAAGNLMNGRKLRFNKSYTPYHSPGLPEYYAYSKSGSFYLTGGGGYTNTYGYMKGEGFFEANTINFGGGLDAGVGGGLEIGQWNWAKAPGSPTIKSLNGWSTNAGYAFGPADFGVSANLHIHPNDNIADFSLDLVGNRWSTYSAGLSMGPYPAGGSGGLSYTYARKISFWKFIRNMF